MENIDNIPEEILIDGDYETREVHINGKLLRPERSQKIRNHSPDGFNWGYGGSGPAQLALAILLQYMNEEEACNYYQDFKFKVVAGWPQEDFEIRLPLRQIIKDLTI
jgi:hypothetical protein